MEKKLRVNKSTRMYVLKEEAKTMIEQLFEYNISTAAACARLQKDINKVVGGSEDKQVLSLITVKRIFGVVEPKDRFMREDTLKFLAEYINKKKGEEIVTWRNLCKDLNEYGSEIIDTKTENVDSHDLAVNQELKYRYFPDREIHLKYLGGAKFEVIESIGSKRLQPGDVLTIWQFVLGQTLEVSSVVRDGENLGGYNTGIMGKLTSIELL